MGEGGADETHTVGSLVEEAEEERDREEGDEGGDEEADEEDDLNDEERKWGKDSEEDDEVREANEFADESFAVFADEEDRERERARQHVSSTVMLRVRDLRQASAYSEARNEERISSSVALSTVSSSSGSSLAPICLRHRSLILK